MCLVHAYRHPSCPYGHVISKAVEVHENAIYCPDVRVVMGPPVGDAVNGVEPCAECAGLEDRRRRRCGGDGEGAAMGEGKGLVNGTGEEEEEEE